MVFIDLVNDEYEYESIANRIGLINLTADRYSPSLAPVAVHDFE
jgi:hypothetical protein